jgi:flagellar biosynthesis/type III secretory pathway chaperone
MEGQAPSLDELQKNLRHQLTIYRRLVDLLREEKDYVVGVRLKELREATYSKEALLDEAHREEYRRQRWVKEAAAFLRVAPAEVTMELVATRLAPREQHESLISLKLTLVHMVKKAKEMNAENQALVQNALRDTQQMKKNILGLSGDKPQTYGPKGNMDGAAREQGARFLSKEA